MERQIASVTHLDKILTRQNHAQHKQKREIRFEAIHRGVVVHFRIRESLKHDIGDLSIFSDSSDECTVNAVLDLEKALVDVGPHTCAVRVSCVAILIGEIHVEELFGVPDVG